MGLNPGRLNPTEALSYDELVACLDSRLTARAMRQYIQIPGFTMERNLKVVPDMPVPQVLRRAQPQGPIVLNQCELEPRPRQLEGATHLAFRRRAALWDPPGFGKTLEAALAATPPVGIVTPTYLVHQWADWLEAYLPVAKGHVYVATGQNMTPGQRIDALWEAHKDPHAWYITNKEMWRPELEKYVRHDGLPAERVVEDAKGNEVFTYGMPVRNTLILDESHHLRVFKAWHTYGIREQSKLVPNIFQLTATPMYKDVLSLFAQLNMLNPAVFKSKNAFLSMYAKMYNPTGWKDEIIGVKNLDVLMANLAKYAIARQYLPGEVPEVMELPDCIVDVPTSLANRITSITQDYRDGNVVYTTASQALNALMRLSICDEKLEAVTGFIEDNNRRLDHSLRGTLVLVKHVDGAAKIVHQYLSTHTQLKWTLITGETNRDHRARLAQHAENVVGTYDAMSEGVDCSHLSLVCRVEPWYLPGQDYQGISRAVRQRHSSHPRAIRAPHQHEPVIVQAFQLRVGPDKTIFNCVRRRIGDVRTVLNEVFRQAGTNT